MRSSSWFLLASDRNRNASAAASGDGIGTRPCIELRVLAEEAIADTGRALEERRAVLRERVCRKVRQGPPESLQIGGVVPIAGPDRERCPVPPLLVPCRSSNSFATRSGDNPAGGLDRKAMTTHKNSDRRTNGR